MNKERLDEIAKETKKEFDYLLLALGENYNCIIMADLTNFKVIELEKKDGNDKS